MFKSGFVLSTDAHLDAAIFNKSIVSVKQDGEILEEGSLIESYTDASVQINGAKFFKSSCVFFIC